jgi:hypothetical protein
MTRRNRGTGSRGQPAKREAPLHGTPAAKSHEQNDDGLWTALTDDMVLAVEMGKPQAGATAKPLIVETAPDARGPWTPVDSWSAPDDRA